MFSQCGFLLGEGDSVVVVVPERLPPAETYTVSVNNQDLWLRAGYERIAAVPLPPPGSEIYRRLSLLLQVGLVEYDNKDEFPDHITNVAYVELRRSA